jgi:hypothetical protein
MRLGFTILIVLLIHAAVLAQGPLQQTAEGDISIVKISRSDPVAVIKTYDGTKQVIHPGDTIGDMGRVIEITEDRVVIERVTEKNHETVVFRLQGKNRSVERYRKVGDGHRELVMPIQ